MKKAKWLSVLATGAILASSFAFSAFTSAESSRIDLLTGEASEKSRLTFATSGDAALTEEQKGNLDYNDKKAGESALVVSTHPDAHYFDVVKTLENPVDIKADKENWAMECWLYIDDINKLDISRDPQIGLRSNDGNPDNQKMFWHLGNYVNSGLIKSGWNHLTFYVGSAVSNHPWAASGNFEGTDLSDLTQFRLYIFEKADVASPLVAKVDDVYLTKTPTKRADGVLLDGSWYDPDTNVNHSGIANQFSEKTPEGKTCLSYSCSSAGSPVGYWPITVPKVGIYDIGDVTNKQIVAQFYIDETLEEDEILDRYREARIDISSSMDGNSENNAYHIWLLGVRGDEEIVNLKPGWNTITIPFSSTYVEKVGNPDTANINYLRPYCIPATNRETPFKIGYIKVTDIPRETTTVTSHNEAVVVGDKEITVNGKLTVAELVNALVLEENTAVKLYDKDGAELTLDAVKAEGASVVARLAAVDTETGKELASFTVTVNDGAEPESSEAPDSSEEESKTPADSSEEKPDNPSTGVPSAAAAALLCAAAAGAVTVISRRRRA